MQIVESQLPGVFIIEPKVFQDARGYFFESYKKEDFEKYVGRIDWVQDNESQSSKGVLRGLHLQSGDSAQAKLVRVIEGAVYDVAVDVRPNSPFFGKYFGIELSANNKKQLFIPRGFAHGFLVLSESCIFQYKVDNYYCKESEKGYHYSSFGIKWPNVEGKLLISEKDAILPIV